MSTHTLVRQLGVTVPLSLGYLGLATGVSPASSPTFLLPTSAASAVSVSTLDRKLADRTGHTGLLMSRPPVSPRDRGLGKRPSYGRRSASFHFVTKGSSCPSRPPCLSQRSGVWVKHAQIEKFTKFFEASLPCKETSLCRSRFQKERPSPLQCLEFMASCQFRPFLVLLFYFVYFLPRGHAILSGWRTCASSTVLLIPCGYSVHSTVPLWNLPRRGMMTFTEAS